MLNGSNGSVADFTTDAREGQLRPTTRHSPQSQMGLMVSPDLGVDGAAWSGAPAVPLIRSPDWCTHRAASSNPLSGAGFATFAGGVGRFTPGTLSTLSVPRWRLPAIARRRWIVASHDKTFERRVAGAERRLSMIEWRRFASGWRHAASERRRAAFGRRVAMIARRLWTIESRLPAVLSRDGMVLSRHYGVGRRGWMCACIRAKKKGLPWGSP